MKQYLRLLLILLPTLSQAQTDLPKNESRPLRKSVGEQRPKKASVFVYTETRRLDTNLFFPKPPDILDFRDTTSQTSEFSLRACLTNLQSLNDVSLTVNGEKPVIQSPTLSKSSDCAGVWYSCSLTLPLPMNTISLEARNEGGASVHYAVVTVVKP